jgi:hypothetical protein
MIKSLRLGGALSALVILAACTPSVESMSCDSIGEEAKRISQTQELKITEIRNLNEQSRTEREARCAGEATFNNNINSPVHLRAYYQGDNTMVEYSSEPFSGAPAQ